MKRTLAVLLASLALVTVGSIYMAFEGAPDAQRTPAAEIKPAQAGAPGLKMISFVHFNDFHAHYQPKDYNGRVLSPLSLLRGYRDQVKAENPNTLFCSAGDDMEKGSIVDLLSNGAATIEIYKELGLDLRAVGNHDFAYG